MPRIAGFQQEEIHLDAGIDPDAVTAVSGILNDLGPSLRDANVTAASQTIAFTAPAVDDVSAGAALFSTYAQEFQTLSAKAADFHDQFVSLLNGGAGHYVEHRTETLVPVPVPVPVAEPDGVPVGLDGNAGVANAAVTLSTPFGPLSLLTANGTQLMYGPQRIHPAVYGGGVGQRHLPRRQSGIPGHHRVLVQLGRLRLFPSENHGVGPDSLQSAMTVGPRRSSTARLSRMARSCLLGCSTQSVISPMILTGSRVR